MNKREREKELLQQEKRQNQELDIVMMSAECVPSDVTELKTKSRANNSTQLLIKM